MSVPSLFCPDGSDTVLSVATARTHARPGDPMRWPVDRDLLTGLCVLHQPDGTALIYLADRRPTTRERREIIHRFGRRRAIVARSSLAEAMIEVARDLGDGRPGSDVQLAKLRRLAGERRWSEFLEIQQEFAAHPEWLVRETG